MKDGGARCPSSLGCQLWAQNTDWPSFLAAARLGRASSATSSIFWTWDHLVSAVGYPDRPVFEGYTTLAAWAAVTSQTTLRSPRGGQHVPQSSGRGQTMVTIDHISWGEGPFGAAAEVACREHAAFGIEFGSGFGERLDSMEEALQVIRPLLHGEEATHTGPRYRTERLRLVAAAIPGAHAHHGGRRRREEDAPQRRPACRM